MPVKTVVLLILASLLNGVICAGAFLFALFATNPQMQDVILRIGFYVLNTITLAAAVGAVAPWVLALRNHPKSAAVFALLPFFLSALAIIGFLTLDSWLSRTFD